jgi:hypothetical protein
MRTLGVMLAVVLLVVAVWPQAACAEFDDWEIQFAPPDIMEGWSSGYGDTSGFWFSYPTGWVNAWFYNGPLILNSGKTIIVTFTEVQGQVEFTINWSSDLWDIEAMPPIYLTAAEEDLYVRRMEPSVILDYTLPPPIEIELIDYNPSWVSIDVRIIDPQQPFRVVGTIEHWCHGPSPVESRTWSAIKNLYR